jgi:hypothetical protein
VSEAKDLRALIDRRRKILRCAQDDTSVHPLGMIVFFMLLALLPLPLHAQTLRFFGSAAAEAQLTSANAASPLNPRNVAGIPYRTNTADATLFADAKTDTWKLHVKLRGDASDQGSDRLTLGEPYAQFTPKPWLELAAGRIIEKWGTGYAWNPTAFVSPRKNPADPNDRRAAYRGVDMLRADVFVRGTSVSLYALGGGAAAARVYRLVGGTDISLHFRHDHHGTQQGVSLARVFGDALELHGEIARRRIVAGGQYTFPNNVNVVAELYRDGGGLTAADWRAFTVAAGNAHDRPSLVAANAAYHPLRMGRNYAFTRVDWPTSDGRLDVELITIASLRDGSLLARLTLTYKLRANVSTYLIDTEFAGPAASELAYMRVRRATSIGVRWFF